MSTIVLLMLSKVFMTFAWYHLGRIQIIPSPTMALRLAA
jgi:uncharacterized protein (DUF486 family)